MMKLKRLFFGTSLLILLSVLLAACNFNTSDVTPTPDELIEEPINPLPDQPVETATPTATISPSPSPTVAEVAVQIATDTLTPTPGPPTATFTPEPTLGPWEYVVQSGETLGFILQQAPFNYDPFANPAIIDAVVRVNGLSSPQNIFAGQTLLIPRPTATPIPQGIELTNEVIVAQGGDPSLNLSNSVIPPGTEFDCHIVQEGQTVVELISRYPPLTLETICQLNLENFTCFGCDFEQPSGGPDCIIPLRIDQCVLVPLPTLTPTLSPTPSGNETATPTPTYRPPSMVYPPEGGLAPAGVIELQWVSVGVLEAGEVYLVEVIDTTAEAAPEYFTTTSTSLRLPSRLIPTDGLTHTIAWTVRVAVRNQNGIYEPIGSVGTPRTFRWQSR